MTNAAPPSSASCAASPPSCGGASGLIGVTVAWASAARQVQLARLQLPADATLAQAVQASGLLQGLPENARAALAYGIWGRPCAPGAALQDGDRVEIWRPLRVDPKLARRERFASQGARTAGLFARRRPGGKAGY